jgi:ketosteroid isomerase-like protein
MKFVLAGLLALQAAAAAAQGARVPADAVDAFHAALRNRDTAAALSMLDRSLVVYEFGVVDPTAEAYAFRHLPLDMDIAAATRWKLLTRRTGGEGDERWVLSTYRVTGRQSDGSPIDQTTLETVILRRTAGLFRIVHFHWSTSDAAFQARTQAQRQPQEK